MIDLNRKIVIATDVRFWKRRTGAQQRIFSMVDYLSDVGHEVSVCFVGKVLPDGDDRIAAAARSKLELTSLVDGWKPTGFWESIVWKTKCIFHALFSALPIRQESNEHATRTLEGFFNREFQKRFKAFLESAKPDIVIVEYVTLSYLVPRDFAGVRFAVNTHDILSKRNAVFKQRGQAHWIELSRDQESKALKAFDAIIAIQESEGEEFREMTECELPIIVAGHPAVDFDKSPTRVSNKLTFGLLSSGNHADVVSLKKFLNNVWAGFDSTAPAEFVVAGSICDQLEGHLIPDKTRLMGRVDCLKDFYDQVDVVINPVEFGTGLKVKTIEALAFGKPLLSTEHGVCGLNPVGETEDLPWRVCDTVTEWIAAMKSFLSDEGLVRRSSESARDYAQLQLRPEKVYADLESWISS